MTVLTGWVVTLERRLNARLTRKEHSDICEKSNGDMSKKLDRIELLLEKQHEQSLQHRQWVGDALGTIRTQVAVIRSRAGEDPLDDTGMFKRSGPRD